MKTCYTRSLIPFSFLLFILVACSDDSKEGGCETYTAANAACYCKTHSQEALCIVSTSFSISLFTDDVVALTPNAGNGTLWSKGFVIGNDIYVIDRGSESPHAFWSFDITASDNLWTEKAGFPGDRYGLVGSANGKGYASSYASDKFWEYDPVSDEWTPLEDLPFGPGETHWVEYNGKFYVPDQDGIYEFDPATKTWDDYSNQESSGFGSIFLIGDDMYWFDINNDFMNRFNLATKSFETIELPAGFGSSIVFNAPFVLGNKAYIVESSSLWIFDPNTNMWTVDEDLIEEGDSFPDDVFVIDNKVFLIDNGELQLFEGIPG